MCFPAITDIMFFNGQAIQFIPALGLRNLHCRHHYDVSVILLDNRTDRLHLLEILAHTCVNMDC